MCRRDSQAVVRQQGAAPHRNLATGQAGFPESHFASLMTSKKVKLHVSSQKGGKACCSKVGNHLHSVVGGQLSRSVLTMG